MNIYFGGMCVSMILYIVIGIVISRRVKSIDDYYVAGRRAPVFIIAGSLIASYIGTGMFTGDAAMDYLGTFSPVEISGVICIGGYVLGAVFFGRYLRRMGVLTIPEYFGKRFNSPALAKLASLISVITMIVYLISVIQGIGTLMSAVTSVNYTVCIILAMLVFTFVAVVSGSTGVLITDTIMATLFTTMTIIGAFFIAKSAGGWFTAIDSLAKNPATVNYLSHGGQPGVIYGSAAENWVWLLANGCVWIGVCMVSPWQASRYLMAKDESTVVRSAVPTTIGVFLLQFILGMSATFVNVVKPDLENSSEVMIWASMNLMPKLIGVLVLTGVLAAGISSATTFLSQIGASVTNDLAGKKAKNPIRVGQIVMVTVAVVVIVFNITNPPSIYWIMLLGGAVISSAWLPTVFASVLFSRVTKAGAFAGMLCGFLGCFGIKLYTSVTGASLPVLLDPAIVGLVGNIVAMSLVTALTRVTDEEVQARADMLVIPESEKAPAAAKSMLRGTKMCMLTGLGIAVIGIVLWGAPYLMSLK